MIPNETVKILSQKIIYHKAQFDLFNSKKKFSVVVAGRRSGKTFTSKRKFVREVMKTPGLYFCAAPTAMQAKYIFWDDMKAYFPQIFRKKNPNETNLILYLKNGSEVRIIGLDAPARFEGQPWTGGIIDEFDDLKPGTWESHVRPALDTIGLNTWCIMCGVPEGKKYLFDLSKKAAVDENWDFYTWKSSEILPASVIEAAKRDLSPLQFRQEYEASFEEAAGCVYADYSTEMNFSSVDIDTNLPIQWCHDFNYSPLSSAIIQSFEDEHHIVDEIILQSAVSKNAALEFVERYKNHKNKRVYIFGDYSGVSGEKHFQSSDYNVIEQILRANGWRASRHVRPNPLIKDRQNSLRSLICNNFGRRRLFVNPVRARYTDKGLSRTQLITGSTYQEVEDEYQHITTALGYWAFTRFPISNGLVQEVSF